MLSPQPATTAAQQEQAASTAMPATPGACPPCRCVRASCPGSPRRTIYLALLSWVFAWRLVVPSQAPALAGGSDFSVAGPALRRFGLRHHRHHHPRALGDARRRGAIGHQALEVIARLRSPAGLVGGHAQQLARAVAPRIAVRRKRREPILQVRKVGTVQFQHGDLQPRVVGQDRIDAAVLGDVLVGGDRLGDVAGCLIVRGQAQPAQRRVARRGGAARFSSAFCASAGLLMAKSRSAMM